MMTTDSEKRRTSTRLAQKKAQREQLSGSESPEQFTLSSRSPSISPVLKRSGVQKTKSESLGLPPPPPGVVRDCDLIGEQIVGREILICWDDGMWYDAIVVRYYPRKNEYKLVYRADDGIEITNLNERRWTIAPKKSLLNCPIILDGAIIEFIYPPDGRTYRAMVYDSSCNGARIKVAYINEHNTDTLKGGGWQFLTSSPCIEENTADKAEQYYDDAINAIRVGNQLRDELRVKNSSSKSVAAGRVSKTRRS